MTVFLSAVAAAAALAALVLFLLWPGRPSPEKAAPLAGRCFAHRGLHTPDLQTPENSLAAFRQAAAAGYGIELDIQLSGDGQVVVFHDDTLQRVCGAPGRVDAYPLAELQRLPLQGTGERIPLFSQVLQEVGGRVPLIVELKTGPRRRELCEKALALLQGYRGPFCIESFDPRIVGWFRRRAPGILRGQLAGPPATYHGVPPGGGFVLGNLLANLISRPEFIAYDNKPKPPLVRFVLRHGPLRVVWTARDPAAHAALARENEMIIFEFYRPDPRFTPGGAAGAAPQAAP